MSAESRPGRQGKGKVVMLAEHAAFKRAQRDEEMERFLAEAWKSERLDVDARKALARRFDITAKTATERLTGRGWRQEGYGLSSVLIRPQGAA